MFPVHCYCRIKHKTNKCRPSSSSASSHLIKPVFLSHVIRHDPSKYIPRIQCPILTVYAENDYMVDDISNTHLMTELLWNSHEKHWIYTIEGVNHQFLRSELCYYWNEIDKTVHPELFSLINNWLDDVNQTSITIK